MNKTYSPFMAFLRATTAMAWDAPDETGTGTPDEAAIAEKVAEDAKAAEAAEAAKVAEEAASLKAAEEAEAEAKKAAEEAEKAAEGGTDEEKAAAKEKAALLGEVMDKKAKLKAAQEEAAEARAKLALFGDIDPEKVKSMLQAEKDAEQASLEAKGEFDSVKKMMAEAHAKETEALQATIKELQDAASSKDDTIDKLTVGRAFSDSKYITDELILSPAKTRTIYGDHVGMVDGEVVVYDKPSTDKSRVVMVDGKGDNLSFDKGIEALVEADPDIATLKKTKMAPGGKSKSNASPAKPKPNPDAVGRGVSRIMNSLKAEGEM